jgi:hypothetical protein
MQFVKSLNKSISALENSFIFGSASFSIYFWVVLPKNVIFMPKLKDILLKDLHHLAAYWLINLSYWIYFFC